MARTLYTVVVRIDALDEPVPGYTTEDYVEAFGPFLDRQSAEDFVKGLEEELEIRTQDGGTLPYGTLSFHPCEIQWYDQHRFGDGVEYNVGRIVDNWVHDKDDR